MRGWLLARISRMLAMPAAYVWMALVCAIHASTYATAGNDADQIRAVIGATWDSVDSKVDTDPVVVAGAYAVASWTQARHGGRALLRRGETGWSVVLCSGDPLTQAHWLVEAGVPESDAAELALALATAEAKVPAARRAMFSLFDGVVLSGAGHADHASEPSHPPHP